MPHQEDGEDAAEEIMHECMRRETKAHLRDIAREHGAGRHWTDLVLPAGIPRFIDRPPVASGVGSPAGLCADDGDRIRWVAPVSF